jgi:hypothetical protein
MVLVKSYYKQVTIGLVVIMSIILGAYIVWQKNRAAIQAKD